MITVAILTTGLYVLGLGGFGQRAPKRVVKWGEPAAPKAPVSIAGTPIRGRSDAPVVLIEFADFQCPYCAKFANGAEEGLVKTFVETGQAAISFRNVPIPSHRYAMDAAKAGKCAEEQGKFWPFHAALYQVAGEPTPSQISSVAKRLGLDQSEMDRCVGGPEAELAIAADQALAASLHISVTPTLLVGRLGPNRSVQVDHVLAGLRSEAEVAGMIEGELLGQLSPRPTSRQ